MHFTDREVSLSAGKTFYLFTDGLTDQFGGPDDKKYSFARIRELIQKNQFASPSLQRDQIRSSFGEWKGEGRQTDDVLLVIFRA